MGDDLDDLFGAFDGQQQQKQGKNQQQEQQEKEQPQKQQQREEEESHSNSNTTKSERKGVNKDVETIVMEDVENNKNEIAEKKDATTTTRTKTTATTRTETGKTKTKKEGNSIVEESSATTSSSKDSRSIYTSLMNQQSLTAVSSSAIPSKQESITTRTTTSSTRSKTLETNSSNTSQDDKNKKKDGTKVDGNQPNHKEDKGTATTGDTTPTSNDTRQIATGTSHDKTVRSYTAYPKSMPQHLREASEAKQREQQQQQQEGKPSTGGSPPAKTYAFTLDPFQSRAVQCIDRDESVLVAAHTSAGKTAVAEYAVAKSLKNGQRVVYTSPIKALSNQKFRDLQEEFGDVGLMTGDITINNEATALVMTTEILRSMLYRGSELMREVAWVIYDEVHYMRDSERGVVWEESIILLPDAVKFVFLSATIPNAEQFADWIAEIHHQPCHVVYTNYRPVPLQHYIFPQGGDGLHLVVDERGKFREANFQRAMTTLQSSNVDVAAATAMLSSGAGGAGQGGHSHHAITGSVSGSRKRKRGGGGGAGGGAGSQFADLLRIVKLIMERNLNPVIIFSFSKKDCEKFALALNKEDFTDDVEKDLITQVYTNAIDSLGEDDRQLPQVQALLPLLKRGIGIHHGGLLPILKEIVEILFSEGLVKTLFATETFSIGINMPAKTVVFTNTRKWDGKDFRWLTSGEYIQMSGRAGRRGKDDRGIVIQMLDEKMEPAVCKDILYGEPDPLNSSYKISYNMLLNLMRVEDVDPEYLLRASFHQFQREKDAPGLIIQADNLMKQAEDAFAGKSTEEMALVAEYYQMDQQLLLTKQKLSQVIQKPQYMLRYVQGPGRVLFVQIDNQSYGWGVLVSCRKKPPRAVIANGRQSVNDGGSNSSSHAIDILLPCVDRHYDRIAEEGEDGQNKTNPVDDSLWTGNHLTCRPVNSGPQGKKDPDSVISMRVFTVGLHNIERLSAIRMYVPQDVTSLESRKKIAISLQEVHKRVESSGGIPLLDPIKDMQIKEPSFQTLLTRAEALQTRLLAHALISDTKQYDEEQRIRLVQSYGERVRLLEQSKVIRDQARACQTMSMKDDLKKMKRVLKRLGHVDANGVIQTKGRTACEINTADELLVVELIFTGVFNELTCEQCVALLSCLTFDERMKDDEDSTKGLKGFFLNPFHKLREVARTVVQTQIACTIEKDEEEFVNKFNPGMMEAVFAWCKGAKFVEVQKLTGTYEGTTIRTLRRLEELIRQITSAAKAIGNQELQTKFEKASELIKRDIVFCSSLYL